MRVTKVALLHLETVPGAVEQNRYMIVEAIKHAASVGAEWIVTPELAVCGLQFPQLIGTDWIQPQPDPWMQQVCRLVKTLKRTVFLSCPERDGSRLYNSVFVIDSAGEIIGRHRKINVAKRLPVMVESRRRCRANRMWWHQGGGARLRRCLYAEYRQGHEV